MKLADRRGEIEPSPLEFDSHCRESRILERRKGQPVLLSHCDSSGAPLLTRIWYPKRRWWSSDRIWPYSNRFRRALALLRERGVRVPEERAYGRIAAGSIRFVVFEALEGSPVRTAVPTVDLRGLASFLAELHAKGVYCRSLHLGSVIALDAGGFALVDVADTKLLDRALPLRMRERSLGILCAHPADLEYMLDGNWSELVMEYCRAARLTLTQSAAMLDGVRVQIERRRAKRERQSELQVPTLCRAGELAGTPGARQR